MGIHQFLVFPKAHAWIDRQTARINDRNYLKTAHRLQDVGFDHQRLDARLLKMESEWNIDKALVAFAAVATLVGVGLGKSVHKKYYAIPATVGGFLMQYVLTGWSPPIQALRIFGFRTAREIESERNALKALRGDYNYKFSPYSPMDAFQSALR